MAINILFYNNAQTTLAASLSSSATTCQVAAGSGALFSPGPTGSQYFMMTFSDAATGLINEIVKVTNVTGDVLTIVRAQEGTTGLAWNIGDNAQNLLTAGSLSAIQNEPANTALAWATPRNLAITGDLSATLTGVDGSTNVSAAGTLATVNSSPGTYGDGTDVAQVTVNAKGLVTAASSVAIVSAPKWSNARTLSFTGDATGSANVDGSSNVATALTLATVNSNVGTFGDDANVGAVTVNAKGQVTAASSVAISLSAIGLNKFVETGIALATSGNNSYPHGLAGTPVIIQGYLICVTPNLGYAAGDEVRVPSGANGHGITVWAGATSIGYAVDSANTFINPKGGGGTTNITFADWTLTLVAVYF